MSYQVLARKWRPRDFATLVGQEHVVKALTHALDQKRLHHAWLFTGTRGVGKTSIARILAKSLNCRGADGAGDITSTPCGVCQACTEIDAGRFVDYIELDAASNRGVDEIAQLLDQAVYAPSSGRFKVYMIDEVHMLTSHAFNAMLKTLEEPPPHVKFILATTDPQKIPVTVLSRCLQFNLKQMPAAQIVTHLGAVLAAEGIACEPAALRLLAKAAAGSMRDALSLTDQAIAYSAGQVGEAAVRSMLGALDQTYLVRLLDALVANDGPGLLAVAAEMAERSLSFSTALQDLAALLHRVALAQIVPAAIPDDWPEAANVRRFAAAIDRQDVQLYYQIATLGRQDLPLAPDEEAGFVMTMLRMLAFQPRPLGTSGPSGISGTAPAAGGAALGASGATLAKPATASSPVPASRAPRPETDEVTPAPAAARPPVDAAPARPATPAAAALAAAGSARATRAAVVTPPAVWPSEETEPVAVGSAAPSTVAVTLSPPASVDAPPVAPPAPTSAAPLPPGMPDPASWPALAASLPLRGLAQQLAMQTELVAVEAAGEGGVVLHLVAPVRQVGEGSAVERLRTVLTERFGLPVRLDLRQGEVQATAAVADAEARARRQQEAEEAVATDPFVQALVRDFGATIEPGSIRPAP